MTTQRQPTPPPGIQEAVAGMLPDGAEFFTAFDHIPPLVAFLFDKDHTAISQLELEYTHTHGWCVRTNFILGLRPSTYVTLLVKRLQAAATVCEWLNEHWKPE